MAQTAGVAVCGSSHRKGADHKGGGLRCPLAAFDQDMNVEYHFALSSHIDVADRELPPFSFKRGTIKVTVHAPSNIVHERSRVIHSPFTPDLMLCLHSAHRLPLRVTVCLDTDSDIARERFSDLLYPIAYDAFASLRSWVRVLTYQYWVGHRFGSFNGENYVVSVVSGGQRKLISPPVSSTGLDFGDALTPEVWDRVAQNVAKRRTPRLGRVLFCDGLLRLSEGSLSAAAGLLGIACELEVNCLLNEGRQALNRRKAGGDSIRRTREVRSRPGRESSTSIRSKIQKIVELYRPSSTLNTKTLRSLEKLMARRHGAVHDPAASKLWLSPIPAGNRQWRRLAKAEWPLVCQANAALQLLRWLDSIRG